MTLYRLDFHDTTGIKQGEITDYLALAYQKVVNAPGAGGFTLGGDHAILASLADKWEIRVYRKPDGAAWALDYSMLYRGGKWSISGGRKVFEASCLGVMSKLAWRHVLYYAGVANRSQFTAVRAETIIKTLVSYNAGTSAFTAGGRLRDGVMAGLTVQADGAGGNTLDWSCAWDNLLETLQKLALVAGGDFDLVETSPTAWDFRWFTGQLGTDRSATVKFSLELGNMSDPAYEEKYAGEKTAALVGGNGEGSDRTTAVRTGTNYNISTNNIEMFVDARGISTTAGLNTKGDKELAAKEAIKSFSFKVLQVPACLYGVHYFLGDLVTAINPYTGISYTLKVNSISINYKPTGEEVIGVELI